MTNSNINRKIGKTGLEAALSLTLGLAVLLGVEYISSFNKDKSQPRKNSREAYISHELKTNKSYLPMNDLNNLLPISNSITLENAYQDNITNIAKKAY